MKSVSGENQAAIIVAFNSTSRYLDDLLNIDNDHFETNGWQDKSCWTSIKQTNSSDTEAPFLDLNLSISNGTVAGRDSTNGFLTLADSVCRISQE